MVKATSVILPTIYVLAGFVGFYCFFLCILAIPAVQDQVVYLNQVKLTWFQDVNEPEQWGFLHNQVTPFRLQTSDGESLHAWHILPLGVYQKHEKDLVEEPAGLAEDITERLSFRLLRDDPNALLVLYFHGAAGTLGSGFRPPSYRAMSAAAPSRIHTVAIDYRGFGTSTGSPSEEGLLTDALALVDWALNTAKIPPSRIVLFAQSLGTAVTVATMRHLQKAEPNPVSFSGTVLVAPFADVARLTASYRLAGTVPLLGPLGWVSPWLLAWLQGRVIRAKWPTQERLGAFVKQYEQAEEAPAYRIAILHAQDDYDIPWTHTDQTYWHAVEMSKPAPVGDQEERAGDDGEIGGVSPTEKEAAKRSLGAGGWIVTTKTASGRGVLTEHILRAGLHDRIMSYPAVSIAVAEAFGLHIEGRK